ncbi:hypothetical protein HK102_014141 [Quaeritorhiza haematococci]|nr:hypothetical protein HK102_014141 [Quaeritorhiza haematococci]
MDSQIPLTLPALPPTDGIPIAAFVTVISNLVIVLIAIAFGFYYIGGPFWEIVIINVTSRFPFLIEWFNRAPPSCILTKAIRIYLHDEALCSGGGGEGGREEESAKSEVTKSRQKDVPIGSVGSFDELANAFALPKFGSLDGTASPKTAYFQNPFRDSSNLSAITSSASTPALTTNLPTMPPPTHTTPVSPKDVVRRANPAKSPAFLERYSTTAVHQHLLRDASKPRAYNTHIT